MSDKERIHYRVLLAAVCAIACPAVSSVDFTPSAVVYALAGGAVFKGSRSAHVDLERADAYALEVERCKHFTLVLKGIRAANVGATGARLTLGGALVGSFSIYGFNAAGPRNLSFLLPPTTVSFSPQSATVRLSFRLLDYRTGSLAVDSIMIVCSTPAAAIPIHGA